MLGLQSFGVDVGPVLTVLVLLFSLLPFALGQVTMRSVTRGTAGVGAINQTRRKVDISDRIYLLDPDKSPLTVLLMQMNKRSCYNPKFEWLEDELSPRVDAINYSTGHTAGSLTLTVDNGCYFRPNDIIKSPASGEVMRVTAVSTNVLTVTRSVGATAAGTLADNCVIYIIGNSNAEGTTAREVKSTLEVLKTNYTQIFRTPFAVTETLRNSDLYAEQDLPYQTRKMGIEHMIDIERALWFGEQSVNTTAQADRTTGGLIEFISTNATAVGGTLTQSAFDTSLASIFRYGSKKKVAFLAPRLIQDIHDWSTAKLQTRLSERYYGVKVTRYESAHGTLLLHNMWLFDEVPTYQGYGFIVDMEKVRYRFLRNRNTHLIKNIEDPSADETEHEYLTECGLQCILEKAHGVLTGVTVS